MNPTSTPNVVVQNPTVRKVANIILGIALIVFPTAAVLDASTTDLDFSSWLVPATAVTAFLAGIFGLSVTVPNVQTGDSVDDLDIDDLTLDVEEEPTLHPTLDISEAKETPVGD